MTTFRFIQKFKFRNLLLIHYKTLKDKTTRDGVAYLVDIIGLFVPFSPAAVIHSRCNLIDTYIVKGVK